MMYRWACVESRPPPIGGVVEFRLIPYHFLVAPPIGVGSGGAGGAMSPTIFWLVGPEYILAPTIFHQEISIFS